MFGCEADKGEHAGIGYIPKITAIASYDYNDIDDPVLSSEFNVGDTVSFTIAASDDDLNMQILWVTIFGSTDNDNPYEGPYELSLPDQTSSDMTYYFIYSIVLDDPAGTYIVDFQVEDSKGNLSNEYSLNYTITY